MQVKKQDINVGKAIFEGEIKSGADGSIIVPDIKPDILKVLQVDAETFLTEKTIDRGKLVLKGKVNVNVLYVPESDGECIQCIKGSFEFCETVKRAELEPDMQLIACADAQHVGYKLINSRKIGIEAQVVISVHVTAEEKCTLVSEIEDEEAEMKCENICINGGGMYREFVFKLDETADFPGTKPDAAEILRSNISVYEKEYRALSGKLVVKGRACVSVLYLSEAAGCEHMDFELPFTEVMDMDGLTEACECDVTFMVEETDVSLAPRISGDGKCISVSADIRVCVRCESLEEVRLITDCYFTNCDCDLKLTDISTEETVGRPYMSCLMKEILEKGDAAPEISSIYTAVAKPYITSTQLQNGKIAVSGRVVVYVLYTTDNPQSPVCSINEEIPFSYMVDCENASRGEEVYMNVECEHISCTLNSPGSVEIRCGLSIKGKVIKKTSVKAVSEIEVSELSEKDNAMVIYFVQGDDDIWKIGKSYHVKCEKILSANGMEEGGELIKGEKLIIPLSNS